MTGIRLDEFVPVENISADFDGERLWFTKPLDAQKLGKAIWNAEIEIGLGLNELAVTARITGKF